MKRMAVRSLHASYTFGTGMRVQSSIAVYCVKRYEGDYLQSISPIVAARFGLRHRATAVSFARLPVRAPGSCAPFEFCRWRGA
jgi:hypothetical protein